MTSSTIASTLLPYSNYSKNSLLVPITPSINSSLLLLSNCYFCQPIAITVIFSILFAAIIVVGLLGNIFVVRVIVSDHKLLASSVNQFLLNLALADLSNLIFCSPDVAMVLLDRGWVLPDVACPIIRFLQEYSLYASVLLQMSIGIERFMAICSPLRMQRFSTKTTTIMLGGVWAIAAVFAFPYLRYMGMVRNKSNQYCYWVKISNTSKLLFKYAEFLVLYAVPLVLLAVLYTVMSRVLWGKSSTIADETQQTAILKLRRSVVKMLIISILLYFLCYTPIQGLFVMEMIFHHHIPLARWVRLLLNLLSVMSSSLNPVVYIMCCCHFHSRFLLLLHSLSSFSKSNKYSCSNGDSDFAARLSRSPYVSFRRSMQKHQRHSVTLL